MITVYTRPFCGTCDATKIWLRRNGIPFEECDADGHVAMDVIRQLGHMSLPVVVADNGVHWSGFQIDKLAALKTHHGGSNSGVIDK